MFRPLARCYMKALNKPLLHVGGAGSALGCRLQCTTVMTRYRPHTRPSVEHTVSRTWLGVALGLYRVSEKASAKVPYTYLFVASSSWPDWSIQEQECFNGVQDDKTVRAADDQHCYPVDDEMADQLLPVPGQFRPLFSSWSNFIPLVEQCQQEFRREASVMAVPPMRHFRSVKAIPSVVDSLVPLPVVAQTRYRRSSGCLTKPKTQTTFNFEDFGI